MNWKNVLFLMRVERKSGRLIRGIKATHYSENKFLAYWPYWLAIVIGILGGLLANYIVASVYTPNNIVSAGLPSLKDVALSFFVSLPTLVLVFSIILTMLQQIQLAGVKATSQVIYWLPVTWQEHTLASVLANLFGFPMGIVLGMASGLIVFSVFNGLIVPALLTSLTMFATAFLASSSTEILRILQSRFVGAVYKSSGRAAVWVRFAGSLIFFIVFYIFYFYITQSFYGFIQNLTQIQASAWFIPFVWPALALFNLLSTNGILWLGLLFTGLSAFFIAGLYYLAVMSNVRFGFYEPPAITVQKSGLYAPKTGIIGKLGFTSTEAALISKDLKAFTRRRELMQIFIVPIVFMLLPLMQSLGVTNNGSSSTPEAVTFMFSAMLFLLPSSVMAMSLGNMLIGEEGQTVMRIYASPISPKNLVKSKLFFVILFSIIILIITGFVGQIFYRPSLGVTIVSFLESLFLLSALGSLSLAIGFKGADFSVTRRARMIRQEWALVSFFACAVTALGILSPLIGYFLLTSFGSILSGSFAFDFSTNLTIPVIISGVIALIATVIFYKINLNSAKDLIRKAET